MRKISARRLFVFVAVGLPYFIIFILWNDVNSFMCKQPEPFGLNHGHVPAERRKLDSKPAEVEKAKGKETRRQKAQTKVKGDTQQIQSVRPNRTHEHERNLSHKHIRSVPNKTEVVSSKEVTTVRPSSCNGCFQTNFPILTDQPQLCTAKANRKIDVIFFIVTAHKHRAQRDAIRKTWASITKNNTANVRHVFMLGKSTDSKLTHVVEKEAREFRDMVVFGFHDTYLNLTVKVIASLRWLTTHCQNARLFVKADDDIWMNSPFMTSLLRNHSDSLQRAVGGECSAIPTTRNVKSKWYVPKHLYPQTWFPPYCRGLAYASSLRVAKRIVDVSPDVPFFFIEDIYVGMCLKRLGFGVKNLGKFKTTYKNDLCQGHATHVVTIHKVPPETLVEMWKVKCPVINDMVTGV